MTTLFRTGELARFERLYASSPDPWNYSTSDYERLKYERTLAALPDGELGRTLEVGCSIGVFTELLAARCSEVVAIDFSARAIRLAREHTAHLANVSTVRAAFPEEVPAGPWDVIVCSEILYYLEADALADAVRWLAAQLGRGSSVLSVSWRGAGRDEPLRGDDVHDRLVRELAHWHACDARRPAYRIDRFDGHGR